MGLAWCSMSDRSWSVVRLDDAPLSTAAKVGSTGTKKAMPWCRGLALEVLDYVCLSEVVLEHAIWAGEGEQVAEIEVA
jgi:hypothetical protein